MEPWFVAMWGMTSSSSPQMFPACGRRTLSTLRLVMPLSRSSLICKPLSKNRSREYVWSLSGSRWTLCASKARRLAEVRRRGRSCVTH
ncbi:hypothetical protein TZ00_00695 [Agreia bicolorata]|uniref:Secreted protein n=1 Tax=Agreia bicolorata TaxID=110935 RepID=A0ABR5CII7_9MICO|nr:hypothetical protein TZ00_00695 [Agreia bicolorata]